MLICVIYVNVYMLILCFFCFFSIQILRDGSESGVDVSAVLFIFIPTNGSPVVVKWAGFALFKQLDKLGGCSLTSTVSGSLIWTAPELFLPYGALKKTQTLLSGRDFKELTYLLRVLQCSITFLVVFIHLVNDE